MYFLQILTVVLALFNLFLSVAHVKYAIDLALKPSRTEKETKQVAKSGMLAVFCFFAGLTSFISFILINVVARL